jgi:hypothetical protein
MAGSVLIAHAMSVIGSLDNELAVDSSASSPSCIDGDHLLFFPESATICKQS